MHDEYLKGKGVAFGSELKYEKIMMFPEIIFNSIIAA